MNKLFGKPNGSFEKPLEWEKKIRDESVARMAEHGLPKDPSSPYLTDDDNRRYAEAELTAAGKLKVPDPSPDHRQIMNKYALPKDPSSPYLTDDDHKRYAAAARQASPWASVPLPAKPPVRRRAGAAADPPPLVLPSGPRDAAFWKELKQKVATDASEFWTDARQAGSDRAFGWLFDRLLLQKDPSSNASVTAQDKANIRGAVEWRLKAAVDAERMMEDEPTVKDEHELIAKYQLPVDPLAAYFENGKGTSVTPLADSLYRQMLENGPPPAEPAPAPTPEPEPEPAPAFDASQPSTWDTLKETYDDDALRRTLRLMSPSAGDWEGLLKDMTAPDDVSLWDTLKEVTAASPESPDEAVAAVLLKTFGIAKDPASARITKADRENLERAFVYRWYAIKYATDAVRANMRATFRLRFQLMALYGLPLANGGSMTTEDWFRLGRAMLTLKTPPKTPEVYLPDEVRERLEAIDRAREAVRAERTVDFFARYNLTLEGTPEHWTYGDWLRLARAMAPTAPEEGAAAPQGVLPENLTIRNPLYREPRTIEADIKSLPRREAITGSKNQRVMPARYSRADPEPLQRRIRNPQELKRLLIAAKQRNADRLLLTQDPKPVPSSAFAPIGRRGRAIRGIGDPNETVDLTDTMELTPDDDGEAAWPLKPARPS